MGDAWSIPVKSNTKISKITNSMLNFFVSFALYSLLNEKHKGNKNKNDPFDLAAVDRVNIIVVIILSLIGILYITPLSLIFTLDLYRKYKPPSEKNPNKEVE